MTSAAADVKVKCDDVAHPSSPYEPWLCGVGCHVNAWRDHGWSRETFFSSKLKKKNFLIFVVLLLHSRSTWSAAGWFAFIGFFWWCVSAVQFSSFTIVLTLKNVKSKRSRDSAASDKFTQFNVVIQWLCLRSKCDKLTVVGILIRVLSFSVVEPLTFISLSRLFRHLTGEICSFRMVRKFLSCHLPILFDGTRNKKSCEMLDNIVAS